MITVLIYFKSLLFFSLSYISHFLFITKGSWFFSSEKNSIFSPSQRKLVSSKMRNIPKPGEWDNSMVQGEWIYHMTVPTGQLQGQDRGLGEGQACLSNKPSSQHSDDLANSQNFSEAKRWKRVSQHASFCPLQIKPPELKPGSLV